MIFISLPRDRNRYVVSGAKPPPVFSGLIFEYRVNHKCARMLTFPGTGDGGDSAEQELHVA